MTRDRNLLLVTALLLIAAADWPGPLVTMCVATDEQGRYRGLVPPGQYGFAITYPAQPGPGWLHMVLPNEWSLAPGDTQEVNFDVPLRRIRIRVLDPAKQPIANLPVKVKRKGYALPGGLRADADGWVETSRHPECVPLASRSRPRARISRPDRFADRTDRRRGNGAH